MMRGYGLVAIGVLALGVISAPAAQANEPFLTCPSGRTAVASVVTSCDFADNVRSAEIYQGLGYVSAYSPTTGLWYDMWCYSDYVAHFNNFTTVDAIRCSGGNDAIVYAW